MKKKMANETYPFNCKFYPPKGQRLHGAVGCDNPGECERCGWNPAVKQKRLEKLSEAIQHGKVER